MAPKSLQIQFDRPTATYFPGEDLTGTVIIDLDNEKSVRDLRIIIKGAARVRFANRSTGRDTHGRQVRRTNHHFANEIYCDHKHSLIRAPAGADRVEIPKGRSEYPFTFHLPYNIPSSFEHKVGHIRYTATAVVDIPWKLDWSTKCAFSVVTPLDLNTIPHQCPPIDEEVSENFYFCCFRRGSMNIRIKTPSSGYVPGQSIVAQVFTDVTSGSIRVNKISAKLEENLAFYAEGVKRDTITLQKVHVDDPLELTKGANLNLYVPPVPPSNLNFCHIIDMSYSLHVIVHVSGMHRNVNKNYPISIGTIPLRAGLHWNQTDQIEPTTPTVEPDILPAPLVPPPPSYPVSPMGWNLPPPSYKESMQKADNIKDDEDTQNAYGADQPFAPRYPVFDMTQNH